MIVCAIAGWTPVDRRRGSYPTGSFLLADRCTIGGHAPKIHFLKSCQKPPTSPATQRSERRVRQLPAHHWPSLNTWTLLSSPSRAFLPVLDSTGQAEPSSLQMRCHLYQLINMRGLSCRLSLRRKGLWPKMRRRTRRCTKRLVAWIATPGVNLAHNSTRAYTGPEIMR